MISMYFLVTLLVLEGVRHEESVSVRGFELAEHEFDLKNELDDAGDRASHEHDATSFLFVVRDGLHDLVAEVLDLHLFGLAVVARCDQETEVLVLQLFGPQGLEMS